MSDLGPFRNRRMGHYDIRPDAQKQAENRRYQGLFKGLYRVSQTLRHFANILAGSVIGGLIYFALGQVANGLASIGVPAVCSLYFDLFSAFIQAYIFCTLTMAYVSMAECGDD